MRPLPRVRPLFTFSAAPLTTVAPVSSLTPSSVPPDTQSCVPPVLRIDPKPCRPWIRPALPSVKEPVVALSCSVRVPRFRPVAPLSEMTVVAVLAADQPARSASAKPPRRFNVPPVARRPAWPFRFVQVLPEAPTLRVPALTCSTPVCSLRSVPLPTPTASVRPVAAALTTPRLFRVPPVNHTPISPF